MKWEFKMLKEISSSGNLKLVALVTCKEEKTKFKRDFECTALGRLL